MCEVSFFGVNDCSIGKGGWGLLVMDAMHWGGGEMQRKF